MKKRNWYTILLLVSLLLAAGWKMDMRVQKWQHERNTVDEAENTVDEFSPQTTEENSTSQEPAESEEEPQEEETEPDKPSFPEIDNSFDDVLFIGDSRTDGLSEYGHLGNSDVFADSGLSAYTAMTKKLRVSGEDETQYTLEEILSKRQYKLILVMLGINELGYDRQAAIRKYGELVNQIQELQPDACLVLEANLHMTEEKSEGDAIFNNENINEMNDAIYQLAEEKNLGWLDVNELFDDENGNLNTDFSADGAHILGKYYADWSDWILQKLQQQDVK